MPGKHELAPRARAPLVTAEAVAVTFRLAGRMSAWGCPVKKSLKLVAIAAGASLAVAGALTTAIAAIPDSNSGVITGCYANSNGALRIIDAQSGASCLSSEHRITWPSKGIRNRGAWNSSTIYYVDDLVTYNGQTYLAKLQNRAVTPTNTTNWTLIAARAQGPTLQADDEAGQAPEEDFHVIILSFALPAGSWLLHGDTTAENESSTYPKLATCSLDTTDGTLFLSRSINVEPQFLSQLSLIQAVTLPAAANVRMICYWQAMPPGGDDSAVAFMGNTLIASPVTGVTNES